MAKLPVKLKQRLIDVQEKQIPYYSNLIKRMNENDPYLADWLKEKPVAFYEGLLQGAYITIESMLMDYKCYRGFQENDGVRKYFL